MVFWGINRALHSLDNPINAIAQVRVLLSFVIISSPQQSHDAETLPRKPYTP